MIFCSYGSPYPHSNNLQLAHRAPGRPGRQGAGHNRFRRRHRTHRRGAGRLTQQAMVMPWGLFHGDIWFNCLTRQN